MLLPEGCGKIIVMKGFWSGEQERLVLVLFAVILGVQVLNVWVQSREAPLFPVTPTHATE